MSLSDAEKEHRRKRSEALGQFLEDHKDLFGVNELDDVDIEGPEYFTGAVLILRSRDLAGDGELMLQTSWPYSLGWSEQLGILERIRIRNCSPDSV